MTTLWHGVLSNSLLAHAHLIGLWVGRSPLSTDYHDLFVGQWRSPGQAFSRYYAFLGHALYQRRTHPVGFGSSARVPPSSRLGPS